MQDTYRLTQAAFFLQRMAKIKYDLPNDGFIMYKTADAELLHSTYVRNREMERKSRRCAELSMHNSDSANGIP